MSKGLIDIILDEIFDEEWKGRHGEKLTAKSLKWVDRFGRKGRILRNVYVPKANGETSEIDVMYICQKGIFVIESKNYSGWIFGDEDGQYWTMMLPNRQKNRFYNPIKQNRTHIKWLRQYVGETVPLFSIIAFSERCELKKVTVASEDVKVIKRDYLYGTVRRIWDSSADVLTDDEVEKLHEKLEELTHVDEATKEAHIHSIEARYKKGKKEIIEEAEQETASEIETKTETKTEAKPLSENEAGDKMICPRCGKELVLRTARKGENAGKQFYGCSGFPKCRYIHEL